VGERGKAFLSWLFRNFSNFFFTENASAEEVARVDRSPPCQALFWVSDHATSDLFLCNFFRGMPFSLEFFTFRKSFFTFFHGSAEIFGFPDDSSTSPFRCSLL
jgi:hypothetical protein